MYRLVLGLMRRQRPDAARIDADEGEDADEPDENKQRGGDRVPPPCPVTAEEHAVQPEHAINAPCTLDSEAARPNGRTFEPSALSDTERTRAQRSSVSAGPRPHAARAGVRPRCRMLAAAPAPPARGAVRPGHAGTRAHRRYSMSIVRDAGKAISVETYQ
jgi:hypothetical protein